MNRRYDLGQMLAAAAIAGALFAAAVVVLVLRWLAREIRIDELGEDAIVRDLRPRGNARRLDDDEAS